MTAERSHSQSLQLPQILEGSSLNGGDLILHQLPGNEADRGGGGEGGTVRDKKKERVKEDCEIGGGREMDGKIERKLQQNDSKRDRKSVV